jgi:uncharacterized protein
MMIRLGILADTHYPTRLPTLPFAALEDAFRHVDAILHAGDIETPEVLNHLAGIAPVQAVKGDADTFDLPRTRILTIGGVRIGLAHGHYTSQLKEEVCRLRRKFGYSQHRELTERLDDLLHYFRDDALDVLIFGHSHKPMVSQRGGVLLFNPGAVYAMTLESAQWQLAREQNPARRRMLKQHIRRYQNLPDTRNVRSTVGILEIDAARHIQPRIIELPLIDHALHNDPSAVMWG